MQNTQKKKINISDFYIILAAADFSYSIYKFIRRLTGGWLTSSELFISLVKSVCYLLPLIVFILAMSVKSVVF